MRGQVVIGGESVEDELYIAPTLLDNISWDDFIMQEEIFGPILPVLTFKEVSEIPKLVDKFPQPLALYYFTKSTLSSKFLLNSIYFGGGCINDTIIHLSNKNLPFGGVGNSGMGNYHGKFSFDTFTHYKSLLKRTNFLDIPLRYPPYTEMKNKVLKWILS